MPFRHINRKQGSGTIALPKDDLRRDGLLDDGKIPSDQLVHIDRLGEGTWVVRAVDDRDVPELSECDAIKRLVAERLINMDSGRITQPAD